MVQIKEKVNRNDTDEHRTPSAGSDSLFKYLLSVHFFNLIMLSRRFDDILIVAFKFQLDFYFKLSIARRQ